MARAACRATPWRSPMPATRSRPTSCSTSMCSGWRTTVAAGSGGPRRLAVRRPAVHGGRRQRGRLGAAGPVSPRRLASACRPMRSATPARTGACRSIRWDVVAQDDFRWLRERARRTAELYDGFRIDHLVGFYRTYGWPRGDGAPFFTPRRTRPARAGRTGADHLRRIRARDHRRGSRRRARLRARLARAGLGLPGFRVFRWERYWHAEGHPFRDPSDYPARRWPSRARTTPKRWRSGGKARRRGTPAAFRPPDRARMTAWRTGDGEGVGPVVRDSCSRR